MEQARAFRVRREPLSVRVHAQGQEPGITGSRLGEELSLRTLQKGQRQRRGCAGPGACVWEGVNACEDCAAINKNVGVGVRAWRVCLNVCSRVNRQALIWASG